MGYRLTAFAVTALLIHKIHFTHITFTNENTNTRQKSVFLSLTTELSNTQVIFTVLLATKKLIKASKFPKRKIRTTKDQT